MQIYIFISEIEGKLSLCILHKTPRAIQILTLLENRICIVSTISHANDQS